MVLEEKEHGFVFWLFHLSSSFSSHITWHTIFLLAFKKIVVFSEGILFPPNCILITFSMLFLCYSHGQ
jgi:hypothetical protein